MLVSLYGTLFASSDFYHSLKGHLCNEMKWETCQLAPAVFRDREDTRDLIGSHVDDMMIKKESEESMCRFEVQFTKRFPTKGFKTLTTGRDQRTRSIEFCGKDITVFYVNGHRCVTIDLSTKIRMLEQLVFNSQPSKDDPTYKQFMDQQLTESDLTRYRQIGGMVNFIVCGWRPDAIFLCKRYMAGVGPSSKRFQAERVNIVVDYLQENPDKGVTFYGGDGKDATSGERVLDLSDASFSQALARTEVEGDAARDGKLGTHPLGSRMVMLVGADTKIEEEEAVVAHLVDFDAFRITRRCFSSYAAECMAGRISDIKSDFVKKLNEWMTKSRSMKDKLMDNKGLLQTTTGFTDIPSDETMEIVSSLREKYQDRKFEGVFIPDEENLSDLLGKESKQEKWERFISLLDSGIWRVRSTQTHDKESERFVRDEVSTRQAQKLRMHGEPSEDPFSDIQVSDIEMEEMDNYRELQWKGSMGKFFYLKA